MDRVTVDLLDDDYLPNEGEDVGPDLARAPTEVGVRYLVSLGTAEMDARHLVAILDRLLNAVRLGLDVRDRQARRRALSAYSV